jgi:hypothetical protein
MNPTPVTGTRLSRAGRIRTAALATTCAIGLCLGLAACGGGASSASAVGTPLQQACNAVGDVLQNGPDPGADPVGHAQAQPIPLRAIKISDTKLKSAVDKLADAYQAYASSNGTTASKGQVKTASAQVNKICPGAAS